MRKGALAMLSCIKTSAIYWLREWRLQNQPNIDLFRTKQQTIQQTLLQ